MSQSTVYPFKKRWKQILAGFIDGMGYALFSSKKPGTAVSNDAPKKILLVRLDQIGDAVMTLPLIAALRKSFPDAQIDILAASWAVPVFEHNPALRQVLEFKNSYFAAKPRFWSCVQEYFSWIRKAAKEQYDTGIDCRGDARNIFLLFSADIKRRIGYGSTGGGFLLTDCLPDKTTHEIEKNLACARVLREGSFVKAPDLSYLRKGLALPAGTECFSRLANSARPRIIIHAGSLDARKRWPLTHYQEIARKILSQQLGTVVLTGTEAWPAGEILKHKNLLDLTLKTSLRELIAVIETGDVFLGNDSGPGHIAAALGKKTLILFSELNNVSRWHPKGGQVSVLTHQNTANGNSLSVNEVFFKLGELCRA